MKLVNNRIAVSVFAENLKRIRLELDMTQLELCESCDFHPSVVSHYENTRRSPGMENLFKLVNALNCTYDELLC